MADSRPRLPNDVAARVISRAANRAYEPLDEPVAEEPRHRKKKKRLRKKKKRSVSDADAIADAPAEKPKGGLLSRATCFFCAK